MYVVLKGTRDVNAKIAERRRDDADRPVPVAFSPRTWVAIVFAYTGLLIAVAGGWWAVREATRDNAVSIGRQSAHIEKLTNSMTELTRAVDIVTERVDGHIREHD